MYQIVSNNVNSLDVDKYDYLTRDSHMIGINISFEPSRLVNNAKVINNIITFPKQLDSDIIKGQIYKETKKRNGEIISFGTPTQKFKCQQLAVTDLILTRSQQIILVQQLIL